MRGAGQSAERGDVDIQSVSSLVCCGCVETRWRQLASRRHDVAVVVCMQPVVTERSFCVVIPNYFRLEVTTDGGTKTLRHFYQNQRFFHSHYRYISELSCLDEVTTELTN